MAAPLPPAISAATIRVIALCSLQAIVAKHSFSPSHSAQKVSFVYTAPSVRYTDVHRAMERHGMQPERSHRLCSGADGVVCKVC
jgi:hypothetical protein